MTTVSSQMAPGDVRAWYARTHDITDDPMRVHRLLPWLSPVERVRYDRFHHDRDRDMFLVGRVMARSLVGRAAGVDPRTWTWREGSHGRPEPVVDGAGSGVRFNISHSGGLVVCVLADAREVGIDVEHLHRRPKDRAIVKRYCSAAERADVEAQDDDGWHERFLTYWTLKEAYLKARGLGVSVPLADVSFTLDGAGARISFLASLAGTDARWLFHLARPTPEHILAIAASTADGAHPRVTIEPFAVHGL